MESESIIKKKGVILRIYTNEGSFHDGEPVHEQIMREAHRQKLATATVYRGIMGFDQHHHFHQSTGFHLSDVHSLTIEIVDTAENITKIYPYLKNIESIGLSTIVETEIVKF